MAWRLSVASNPPNPSQCWVQSRVRKAITPHCSPHTKSPDAWLTHPWTGSLPTSSSSCSGLVPSPVCPAPRPRCIPRWGRWVGVCRVPAGREQQRGSIIPGRVSPLGAGKGAVLLPVPAPHPAPCKVMTLLPDHMTSLLKGSPLTGPGQGTRSESWLCRQTACVSIPTLSLPAVRPQTRDFVSQSLRSHIGKMGMTRAYAS